MTHQFESSCRALLRPAVVRPVFWVYAVILATLTHWPGLAMPEMSVERPDLFVHAMVFAGWTGLLWLTAYLGPLDRFKSVALCCVVAGVVAFLDESLQALPIVGRHATIADLGANFFGVLLGGIASLAGCAIVNRRHRADAPAT